MRRRCAAVVGALVAFLIVPASPVAAHASFLGSDPTDGSVLVDSPAVAELRFSDEVLANASHVELSRLGSEQTEALTISTAHDGHSMMATLPDLDTGAYVLRYVVVDPTDLHKTVGSVSFGIGVAAPPSVRGGQLTDSWALIAVRGLTDTALLLCAGAAILSLLLVRSGGDPARAGRVALWAGWAIATGWVALLVADAAVVGLRRVQWSSLVINSDPGRRALIGVQLAAGMWWAVGMLRRSAGYDAQRFVGRIAVLIAAGFVLAAAYGGHAAIGGSFGVGVVLRAVHLASLCVWLGVVGATWMVARHDHGVAELWPTVSRLAGVGVAVTGASGLILSGRLAATVTALLGTAYGRWIIAKVCLLAIVAVLGAVAARRVCRGAAPRGLPAELAIAAAAVMIAAIMASSAPARGEQFLPSAVTEPQIITSNVDDLTLSASIDPGRPGPNLVQLRVLDTRRPSPGPVENVVMRVEGADGAVVAERHGVPTGGLIEWADVAVPNPGTYRVQVEVTRLARPVPSFVASWKVDAVPVPRVHRVVSTRSWAPFAAGLALVWIVLITFAWRVIEYFGRPSSSRSGRRSTAIGRSAQLNVVRFSIPGPHGTMTPVEERHKADSSDGQVHKVDGLQLVGVTADRR